MTKKVVVELCRNKKELSNAASRYFTRHVVAEQAELSCAGVET